MIPAKDIFAEARQRAADQPYAGAVTPQEAYDLLLADPNVLLIDVRTNAERDWVGRVKVPPAQHAAIEWNSYPGGAPNPAFVQQLRQAAKPDAVVLFLCRSGVRSRHAAKAATENGYAHAYDILEGFEGDKDSEGHRKRVSAARWTGWSGPCDDGIGRSEAHC
jgi:rhodanese-related sulfurtransferase